LRRVAAAMYVSSSWFGEVGAVVVGDFGLEAALRFEYFGVFENELSASFAYRLGPLARLGTKGPFLPFPLPLTTVSGHTFLQDRSLLRQETRGAT
jgi:hypothetical protein